MAPGGSHEVMFKGELKISIPNPHRGDICRNLLSIILHEAGIFKRHWGTPLAEPRSEIGGARLQCRADYLSFRGAGSAD